jgi:hypothetical protein
MSRKRMQYGARLMLSALLAVTAAMPPDIRHSHARGDEPHRHDLIAGHDHAGCGRLHHCHPHQAAVHGRLGHAQARDAVSDHRLVGLVPSIAHWHFFWGMSLPVPRAPGNGEKEENGPVPAMVQPFWNGLPDFRVPLNFASFEPTGLPAPSISIVCVVAKYACTPAATAPLCDAARHERTGVQLI